jgi:hypothetical protein
MEKKVSGIDFTPVPRLACRGQGVKDNTLYLPLREKKD